MVDARRYEDYLKTPQWRAIANKRLMIDGFTCQGCGSKGTSINPLEVHHISYKCIYHEDERVYEDLVTVCHSCHNLIHSVMNRITNEDGRRGWKDNYTIPKTNVYTISGSELLTKD